MPPQVTQWPVPISWFTTVGQAIATVLLLSQGTFVPSLSIIERDVPKPYNRLLDVTEPKIDAVQTRADAIESYLADTLSPAIGFTQDMIGDVSLYLTEVLSAGIVDIRDRVADVDLYQTEVLSAGIVDIQTAVADVSSFLTDTMSLALGFTQDMIADVSQLLETGVVPLINQVQGVVTSTQGLLGNTVVPGIQEVWGSIVSLRKRLVGEVIPTTEEILGVAVSARRTLERAVVQGIAEVLGGVESTQDLLVESVVPVSEEILGAVIPTRQVLEGHVVPGIAQVVTGVQTLEQILEREVAPTTEEILGVVTLTLEALEATVMPGIAQVFEGVQATHQDIVETVVPVTQEILDVVQPTYQAVVANVVPGVAQVWQGIVTLNSGLHDLTTDFFPLMPGPTGPPTAALGLLLAKALEDLWPQGPLRVGEAAKNAIDALKDTILGWYEDFKDLPRTYLDFVAEKAGTDLALDPARAFETVGELYGLSIGAGTVAHLISTALNAIPTLNWVGASQLSAFVAEVAGFKPITDASYGVLLNQCIAWPLRYYWNQKLRPKIPTEGSIYAMGRKRGLDYAEFSDAMAMQGLPQSWIDKEYDFFWADPSPYWLLRMSEHSTPAFQPSGRMSLWLDKWLDGWRNDPWYWYKMKLMLAGFEDSDIDPFIDSFQRRRLGPAITQVKTSVRAMVREGYWGRTEVKGALEPLGVREAEIDLLIKAEEIDYQNRFADNEVRYLTESFRKGDISRQDLSLSLSLIIVKTERVAQIVDREQIRALPKPKSVVPVKEDPRVKSLVTQAVNSWIKGYRDWEVEEEELEIGLNIVLQDPPLAEQLVVVERTRYRPEPPPPKPPVEDPLIRKSRVAAIATWVAQFREGKITVEVMELGLANLIFDPGIVTLIRQIEELRAVPAPDIIPPWEEDPLVAAVREETVRGHIEMFRKRIIDIDELYAYLLADGLAESLARATALTQALKRIKTPSLEAPYFQKDRLRGLIDEAIDSYTRMLELGQITMEQFEAYLAGVGVDPDVITYIGDSQQVRQFLLLEGMA